jgi:uncharacterized membrane protein
VEGFPLYRVHHLKGEQAMSPIFVILLQIAILSYAFVGGVFLAFSDFIMRSLAQTGSIDAMQAINREVFRWVFMMLFLGMAPLSLVVAVYGGVFVGGGPGMLMLAAGLIYVIGCFGVTVRFNVPMNEALAKMKPSENAAQTYWTGTYVPRWTLWNSVRTLACGVSAALLLLGLVWMTHLSAQPL